uniref:Reverse transcriptase zinc-binding domain-containing protein n=1 Tax=Quercus lobata TaxID=97700 RepID=A0A7N2MF44_QUELO
MLTVRSAYLVALHLNHGGGGEHSKVQDDRKLWHKMWKLDVPPKVRTFLWRACSEILPTRANLARKRLPIDPRCDICRHEEETVCHVLWECPLATNVWALFKGKLQKCIAAAPDFYSLAKRDEREAHGEGIRSMGDGQLVHLERQKLGLLRAKAVPTS